MTHKLNTPSTWKRSEFNGFVLNKAHCLMTQHTDSRAAKYGLHDPHPTPKLNPIGLSLYDIVELDYSLFVDYRYGVRERMIQRCWCSSANLHLWSNHEIWLLIGLSWGYIRYIQKWDLYIVGGRLVVLVLLLLCILVKQDLDNIYNWLHISSKIEQSFFLNWVKIISFYSDLCSEWRKTRPEEWRKTRVQNI